MSNLPVCFVLDCFYKKNLVTNGTKLDEDKKKFLTI